MKFIHKCGLGSAALFLIILPGAIAPAHAANFTVNVGGENLDANFLGSDPYWQNFATEPPYFLGDFQGALAAVNTLIPQLETANNVPYFKFYVPVIDPRLSARFDRNATNLDYLFVGFVFEPDFTGKWVLALSEKQAGVSPSLAPWSTWIQFTPSDLFSLNANRTLTQSTVSNISSSSIPEPSLFAALMVLAAVWYIKTKRSLIYKTKNR
jgi:hypothetical protein